MLRRTLMGRYLYAVGTREGAAYLSGIDTRKTIAGAFVLVGPVECHRRHAARRLRQPGLPEHGRSLSVAGDRRRGAGGTSILGGRGSYAGTVTGVLLITLITSMLSVMQIAEAFKQIAYGAVIIAMVGYYSRRATAERS